MASNLSLHMLTRTWQRLVCCVMCGPPRYNYVGGTCDELYENSWQKTSSVLHHTMPIVCRQNSHSLMEPLFLWASQIPVNTKEGPLIGMMWMVLRSLLSLCFDSLSRISSTYLFLDFPTPFLFTTGRGHPSLLFSYHFRLLSPPIGSLAPIT